MCGIAGYLGNKRFEAKKVKEILHTMRRRGPDSNGFREIRENKKYLSLFFSRLNIIDANIRSNQPYCFKDKILIFNGEIYNYLELKTELKKNGYNFKTTSDTEVLIKALDFWNENAIKKLEGMWSFYFYDITKKRGILCRDRFGEKPLFNYKKNNEFIFSSEIKTISRILDKKLSINYDKIDQLLRYGYRKIYNNDSTYFNEIFEFPKATYFIIKDNKIIKKNYWNFEYKKNSLSSIDSYKRIKDKLFKAIEIRLRSDFPIAFFLSGGIDSNTLAFIAKNYFNYDVKTFSIIGKDKRWDESEEIKYSVKKLGTPHQNLAIDMKKIDFIKILNEQVKYHDSPVVTINSLLQFILFKKIKKTGYRLTFSGLGGDEIFSGYYDHHLLYLNELNKNSKIFKDSFKDWQKYVLPITRNPLLKNYKNFSNNKNILNHTIQYEKFKDKIFKKSRKINFVENLYVKSTMKNRMINQLTSETVPIVLKEDDLNSMYHSIEHRSPYLDSKLFQECLNMPSEYYINNGMAKWPLRKIVEDIVPDRIRLRREKKGFNAPVESLFNFGSKKNIDYILKDCEIFEIIEKKYLIELLKKKKNFSSVENIFLFNFISTKIFLNKFS